MKLGRRPSAPDRRDLRLTSYLPRVLTPAPPMRNWTRRDLRIDGVVVPGPTVAFDTFGNLERGCCTCAAIGHIDQAAAAHTGFVSTFTTDKVLEAYDAISDWDRSSPRENDTGASCRDALKHFRATGAIEAYLRLDDQNRKQIETAVNLAGAVYVGADLPRAAQRQQVWDVAPLGQWTVDYEARSWGGHAMALLGYDRSGVYFATWGRVQRATWSWVFQYVDEAWLVIADLWTNAAQLTPSGFDLERLRHDVAGLTLRVGT